MLLQWAAHSSLNPLSLNADQHICLVDDKPFRLPYRWVPPCHYNDVNFWEWELHKSVTWMILWFLLRLKLLLFSVCRWFSHALRQTTWSFHLKSNIIIYEDGVKTDPSKVQGISNVQDVDLMESDGKTLCAKKIRSFLGMVLYYHHFIEGCSAKAKPLLNLVAEPAAPRKRGRGHKPKLRKGHVKLSQADWTDECRDSFKTLKHELLHSFTLQ